MDDAGSGTTLAEKSTEKVYGYFLEEHLHLPVAPQQNSPHCVPAPSIHSLQFNFYAVPSEGFLFLLKKTRPFQSGA